MEPNKDVEHYEGKIRLSHSLTFILGVAIGILIAAFIF
jgi:hypothetical protein